MESMDIPDRDGAGVTDMLEVTELPNTANMEAVILDITVNHSYGSDLGVTFTSPGGTESIVNAPFNPILDGFPGMLGWQLMSNAFTEKIRMVPGLCKWLIWSPVIQVVWVHGGYAFTMATIRIKTLLQQYQVRRQL